MKPLGKIDLGEFYLGPWNWNEGSGNYTRPLFRVDKEKATSEDVIRLIEQAGLKGDFNADYSSMEKTDKLLFEFSERISKLKSFQ